MKKKLIVGVIALLSLALTYGFANAAVTGTCSSCHTMHDSQNGVGDIGSPGQQPYLTLFSCLACHTSGGAANAPKIDGTNAASGTGSGVLSDAGGDYDATVGDKATRHDLLAADVFDMVPPGYVTAGGLTWTNQKVTCEGTYGCHGKHGTSPDLGVHGMHHGTSTAFRWLYAQTQNTGAAGTAVNGLESTTWEAGGATQTNHNVYDSDSTDSVSIFCANCHGIFHDAANTGSSSPFTRHPTDEEAVIANIDGAGFTPTSAEIDETPFAFTTAQITAGMVTTDNTTGTAYTSANGKAMCLSCHRAHGTAYKDILRFNYSDMNAGNTTNNHGCETCHVNQR